MSRLRFIAPLLVLEALLAVVGLTWATTAGFPLWPEVPWWAFIYATGATLALLLVLEAAGEALVGKSLQSLERLEDQMARQLRSQGVGLAQASLLALAAGIGEELFFRAALFPFLSGHLGLVHAALLQALLFALMHPVPDRQAWAYPVWAFIAALVFVIPYQVTQSPLAGVLAHAIYDLRGFYQMYRRA